MESDTFLIFPSNIWWNIGSMLSILTVMLSDREMRRKLALPGKIIKCCLTKTTDSNVGRVTAQSYAERFSICFVFSF